MSDSALSPLSRPIIRRGRVSHACVACQQRKQKCDGGSPSCRNCLRGNRTCIIQDPATKRRHPRGYIESLEQHVAFLEQTLQDIRPGIDINRLTSGSSVSESQNAEDSAVDIQPDDDTAMGSGAGNAGHDAHPLHASSLGNPAADPMMHVGVDAADTGMSPTDDVANLEMLCLQSAGGDPHYFGTSSAYSMTKLFSATLRAVRGQGPGLTLSGVPDPTRQSRPSASPSPLPDAARTRKLTTAYFEQVHPQFPFIHQPTYAQWEDGVFEAYRSGTAPNASHLFFVYAVAAVGALTGPLASSPIPEGLYASAERLFEQVMKLNTLESIQAILCCAMYSLRSPIGVSVWTLSGIAIRQCVELGLHRKIPWTNVESDVLKTQTRRRVFWCSYNLDRAVAVTLGRPVGISDADIDVEFPLDISDEHVTVSGLLREPRKSGDEPPTTVSSAIHTIRFRKLVGRIQSAMYPQTGLGTPAQMISSLLEKGFKAELKEWLDTAPAQLASNRAHNNAYGGSEWFELMYHHAILLLHRHSLVNEFPSSASMGRTGGPASGAAAGGVNVAAGLADEPHPSIHVECASAAQAICQLYRQLYLKQQLNDTWGALHVLFLGGISFLYCLWNSLEVRAVFRLDKVAATCMSCVVVLAVMAERWEAVRPYRDTFEMLANYTQTMLAETEAAVMPVTMPLMFPTSTNHQLADYLSSMAEVGMCSSVEALLNDMIMAEG